MNKLNLRGGAAGSSHPGSRKALLLGTALASSLMALPLLTATQAQAQTATCLGVPSMGGPTPIVQGPPGGPIVCVNTEPRVSNGTSPDAINLSNLNDSIFLYNSGNLTAVEDGIDASIDNQVGGDVILSIVNSGDVVSGDEGIVALLINQLSGNATISINNSSAIAAASNGIAPLIINQNSGDVTLSIANSGGVVSGGIGIYAATINQNSGDATLSITNSGDFVSRYYGIVARLLNEGSGDATIDITNSGDVAVVNANSIGLGIGASLANLVSGDATISIANSGDVAVNAGNIGTGIFATLTNQLSGDATISIANSGDIAVSAGNNGYGIFAQSLAAGSPVTIVNSGNISVSAGGVSVGIFAFTASSNVTIANLAGGSISSSSGLAIDVDGGGVASIFNSGLITGFVDLTDQGDLFVNQQGGVFQAQGTSLFGMGNDLFTNQVGGLVDTADNAGVNEMVAFQGLETFQNFGTISLLDGAEGDLFTIANTLGGTDLNYVAGSFLAVDAFLGGPGSRSDIFRIDGNAQGVTHVVVNNTNPLPGTFNPDGITVVQVRGAVDPSAFRLANGPIDTGFFNYDLFFEGRDGAGDPFDEFELRSFPGAGAQLLPQLVTAAQDIWHQTSDTWFDRSADLRTQLWRNGGSVSGVPGVMSLGGGAKDGVVAESGGLSPAVWARVSHGELEQDGSARTNAFGRSFEFNLDRELYIIDVQSGVDFALQGVMNPSDVLLLSVFGGGVSANLQYDQLDRRRFDYDGGQVGVAATYLSGGLFVDALFNAQFLEVDPNALGFAESLDSNAYGFRIDTGYRFGMGSRGLFLEPLLTLAYVNSDLDGFSFAGNTVSFQDEDSLRGRVGLRAGTSLFIENVRFEPFVIASYWGELSDDDNRATLVSSGTRFGFRDEREDGWGEVSLGTNTFLAGNNALSAFSKIDIIFGDDTEGYIAQGGFRVQW